MSGAAVPAPDFLFEVTYCDQMNAKFAETRGEQDLIYAFHGSRLENFHSILHNGLHCHLNRVRLLVLLMGTNPCWSPAATNTWTGCSPLNSTKHADKPALFSLQCRPWPTVAFNLLLQPKGENGKQHEIVSSSVTNSVYPLLLCKEV